jgi:hypothetical protein
MRVIIVGACLLNCLAVGVGVLSRGRSNKEGDNATADQQVDASFDHQIVL